MQRLMNLRLRRHQGDKYRLQSKVADVITLGLHSSTLLNLVRPIFPIPAKSPIATSIYYAVRA